MPETSYPSWNQPVAITIPLGDLPPVMKFSLDMARTRDGWDTDKLHALVALEFDFLGSPVSERVETDPQQGAEVVVIEFTPPAERDRSAAEADFDGSASSYRVTPRTSRVVAFPDVFRVCAMRSSNYDRRNAI